MGIKTLFHEIPDWLTDIDLVIVVSSPGFTLCCQWCVRSQWKWEGKDLLRWRPDPAQGRGGAPGLCASCERRRLRWRRRPSWPLGPTAPYWGTSAAWPDGSTTPSWTLCTTSGGWPATGTRPGLSTTPSTPVSSSWVMSCLGGCLLKNNEIFLVHDQNQSKLQLWQGRNHLLLSICLNIFLMLFLRMRREGGRVNFHSIQPIK